MSLRNIPSEEEVMRWNPQCLADYMRKLKLCRCDEVVLKSNITGTQFMKMTHSELEVFPGLYVPTLMSIRREIRRAEQRNAFGPTSKTQKHLGAVFVKSEEAWESDESDNENVYERPSQNDEDEDYICALAELQTAEKQHSGKASRGNDMLQTFAQPMKSPRLERGHVTIKDCRREPAERTLTSPHPHPTKTGHTSPRPLNASAPILYSDLKMVKIKKPELPSPTLRTSKKSNGSIVLHPGSSSIKPPQPPAPRPPRMSSSPRINKPTPALLMPTKPVQETKSIPGPRQMKTQSSGMPIGRTQNQDVDLDSSWYGGKVTRSLGEMALREVNKDGAFLVRDSSTSFTDHHYTLMILNKGKVYNIKICNHGNSYLLGNGLRHTQSFPGVREMINHHTHTPLLLIDGREQSSEEQPLCRLQHPVGI